MAYCQWLWMCENHSLGLKVKTSLIKFEIFETDIVVIREIMLFENINLRNKFKGPKQGSGFRPGSGYQDSYPEVGLETQEKES